MNKSILTALAALLLVTGCASREVYRSEEFKEDSPYSRSFALPAPKVCESAQMALLSQGYRIVGETGPNSVAGQKDFQAKDESYAVIEIKVVCMERAPGSLAFASAVQTKYELKKSRQSTSLGIPVIGALSLPLGTEPEALVKVGAETISDWEFYSSFFDLMKGFLE